MSTTRFGTLMAALLFTIFATPAASQAGGGCGSAGIADLPSSTHWMGSCTGGRAEGIGVLRAGAVAPFGFFAGRMRAGRPGAGVIILANGMFEVAAAFDSDGHPVPTDSLHPEQQDEVFALAARAARATADRFARAGNRASANYYRGLARRIANGQSE